MDFETHKNYYVKIVLVLYNGAIVQAGLHDYFAEEISRMVGDTDLRVHFLPPVSTVHLVNAVCGYDTLMNFSAQCSVNPLIALYHREKI